MRYLVTGTLVTAGIVLGSVLGVRFAMEGAMSLAWTALGLGVLGWFVLIVCLWLYARSDAGDGPVVYSPMLPHSPASGRARAQDRPWLTDPQPARTGAHDAPANGRARAQDRPSLKDPQPARTGPYEAPAARFPRLPDPPARGRVRGQERAWRRDPQPVDRLRPVGK